MKENSKLSELTLEELQIEQKKYKNFVISFCIVAILALITSVYFIIKNKSYLMFFFLGGFSGVFYLIFQKLKQLRTEIKSRNSQL